MKLKRAIIDDIAYAYIDVFNKEDISIDHSKLVFNVKTYSKLKKNTGEEAWDILFRIPNDFLDTFSREEKVELAQLYVNMREGIDNISGPSDLGVFKQNARRAIAELFAKYNLADRATTFVRNCKDIFMPDFQKIGISAHHTEDKTFNKEECIQLISLSVVCKLLSPIFGHIIEFVSNSNMDNKLKETHAVAIMRDVVHENYEMIENKINRYIASSVNSKKSDDKDHTKSFNGNSNTTLSLNCYALLLTKNFVNIDLLTRDIAVEVFNLVTSRSGNTVNSEKRKAVVQTRLTPDNFSADAESNRSMLETESFASKDDVDVPILVKMSARTTIGNLIEENNIPKEAFDEAVVFYNNNSFPETPLNKYVISTFLGHKIGGAHGIDMLYFNDYARLVAYTQLYMVLLSKKYPEKISRALIHSLTLRVHGTKTETDLVDHRIQNMGGASAAYKQCESMFLYSVGDVSWNSSLTKIIEHLTGNVHNYNTAPSILDMMGNKETNGAVFKYDDTILANLFDFIFYSLQASGQQVKE